MHSLLCVFEVGCHVRRAVFYSRVHLDAGTSVKWARFWSGSDPTHECFLMPPILLAKHMRRNVLFCVKWCDVGGFDAHTRWTLAGFVHFCFYCETSTGWMCRFSASECTSVFYSVPFHFPASHPPASDATWVKESRRFYLASALAHGRAPNTPPSNPRKLLKRWTTEPNKRYRHAEMPKVLAPRLTRYGH